MCRRSGSGWAAPNSWEVELRVSAEGLKSGFHRSWEAFRFLYKGYSPADQALGPQPRTEWLLLLVEWVREQTLLGQAVIPGRVPWGR